MADVDITSLSVEISAESQGAELNIDKLATAISNLRTKGNVTKVVNSLDRLSASISALKSASAGLSGLDKLTGFLDKLSGTDLSASAKSINSVGNAIKKIAAVDIGGIDLSGLSGKMSELQSGLSPLAGLDASGLKGIGSAINALGKIPGLTNKLDSSTLDAFAKACEKISTSLTPLASQLDKVGNAFAKLPPQLSKVVTQANRVTAANEKQRKSYLSLSNQMNGFMRNMAKLVSLKAIADYLGNAVAKFNDFYEATNMFGVSMKGLTGEADNFIQKMQTLLGIDPTEAMNNMATIQGLTTSFGLASDKAYILSKNLTQLGYDLSSLKNIPVKEAFTKLQAAISGELEPIRRSGVDISNARLQQELYALGITTSISKLSQADKAILRYIAIMKQAGDAQGDLARTLNSPANQIRILQAQLSELARAVGSVLYPALKSILPPLIAAVELVKEFVQWIAKLMGVKTVDFPDMSKTSASVEDTSDALDNAAASAGKAKKALKDYTMGFDELNIIDPTKGSSGSGSGSGVAGNILGDVDLSQYDMFKQYNEDFAKQIDAIKQKIKAMLPLIATVATALAAWKLTNLIMDIVDAIHKMNALKSIVLGLGVFTVGIVLEITGIKDAIENGVNGKNFAEIVLGALIGTTGAAILGKGIAQFIVTGFGNTAVGAAIKAAGGSTAGAIIGAAVGGVVTGIPMFVTGVYDAVKNGLNTLNGILIPLGSTMTGAGIGAIIGSLGGPIGTGIGALIGLIVGGLTDAGIAIYQNWDKITESLDKASVSLKNWFVGVGEWWNEKWQGFSTNFQTAWESLPGFVQHPIQALNQASAGLKQWFVGVGEWWNQKWAGFKKNWDKAWNSLVDTIKNLPAKFLDYGKNIVQGLINGINNGIENAKETVSGLAKAIIDKFTTETDINSPSKLFEQFGIYIDQGLANGITSAISYVTTAMQGVVDAVQEKGNELIDYGATAATNFVNGFFNGLDSKWQELDSGLQNDFFGTVQNLWNAVQSGDLKTVGTAAAAIIWQAMGEDNRTEVKTYANDLISQLSGALKKAAGTIFDSALQIGKNIWKGITNNFGDIVNNVSQLGQKIYNGFSSLKVPLTNAGFSISDGLLGGLVSKFPEILTGVAGVITSIGGAFMGILETIGGVLTSLGIPTGVLMLAGGVAIAAAIAGVVGSLNSKYGSNSSVSNDYSSYPGTSGYDSSTGSTTSTGSYYPSSSTSGVSASDLRSAVHDGCYNAFLDIFQRYGDEITGGKEIKLFIDGKQITASVEKQQSDRGVQIMGTEVYSY